MSEIINQVAQLVQNLGFPIVCVGVMFYSQWKEREAHQAESKQWVDALNNNTVVLNRLLERMDRDDILEVTK